MSAKKAISEPTLGERAECLGLTLPNGLISAAASWTGKRSQEQNSLNVYSQSRFFTPLCFYFHLWVTSVEAPTTFTTTSGTKHAVMKSQLPPEAAIIWGGSEIKHLFKDGLMARMHAEAHQKLCSAGMPLTSNVFSILSSSFKQVKYKLCLFEVI